MKIEEERKRLAVEKVQVEKMRNEMDQKTKGRGRNLGRECERRLVKKAFWALERARGNTWFSNEGLRKGCLPQQLMLYPGFPTMTEGKVDDLVKNFKEVLNKENYEELHLPFSENVRPPLEEALVKMRELFTLERSCSL
ncbi:hypothetical protein CAPTEDRAFT_212121 [Capitella teleta]|uniref:Uncharacterized protein n=1 Tax=Capitella teleta TaxID=283909 RepID=R7THC7_CAPTE|nr:hypothetical protein CAPTEDRAFT_212121 [Capitella teleta]|eukprot:ELT92837.1 hypothetical protein CAPTEDRAFT_212121 [Capitella teleta]